MLKIVKYGDMVENMDRYIEKKRICIVATSGISLINFRGELIKSWINRGYDVVCVSIEPVEELGDMIRSIGATYYQVAGDRTSIGIISGIRMIKAYRRAFQEIKPDYCFLYMSKPVAFGGVAAIQAGIKHINVLVNGMENAYYRKSIKDFIVRCVMSTMYWFVGRKADNVFFQNHDDMNYFIEHRLLTSSSASIVNGSGVDMTYFPREELPEKPVVLMVARLLWSKGIKEYLEAAAIVKERLPDVKFLLVGGLDSNDEAISKEELEKYIKKGEIEYCGKASDVRPFLKQCSIFVLPSYHEGLPRCVLEAMAVGRAIVTTNAPGCRETVESGKNGFLIPQKNSKELAEKIMYIIEHPELLKEMANESYNICIEKFEVSKVNAAINQKMLEDK